MKTLAEILQTKTLTSYMVQIFGCCNDNLPRPSLTDPETLIVVAYRAIPNPDVLRIFSHGGLSQQHGTLGLLVYYDRFHRGSLCWRSLKNMYVIIVVVTPPPQHLITLGVATSAGSAGRRPRLFC